MILLHVEKHRAFSMVEVLVAIGLIAILIALVLPSAHMGQAAARGVKTLSNQRQLGLGVQMYANENDDLPPVLGVPSWPPSAPWNFDFGTSGGGYWFDHSYLYSLEIVASLGDPAVAVAPGNPNPRPIVNYKGRPTRESDFFLTNTLYADPKFFSWETQAGARQFHAQRISSAALPASKGMIWTPIQFSPGATGAVASCCVVDVASPILFFDQSSADLVMKNMKPGMCNLYEPGFIHPTADPKVLPGTPVANTFDGIKGTDRK